MNILLVNPPNCGRSIPEERYGIDSLKLILRGEPLGLETLAGNLAGHEVRICDLKAESRPFSEVLAAERPELVGFTAMTCEAQTVLKLAGQVKSCSSARVVVGGVHASNDPDFFNRPEVDFIVLGLGKQSFRELVDALRQGDDPGAIPGVAASRPGKALSFTPRRYCQADLAEQHPPRYDLVEAYRDNYFLPRLNVSLGLVASAAGCPYDCSFCCIAPLTGSRYLTHTPATVVRDIELLGETPFIRLVDANTFGNQQHALELLAAIRAAGLRKHFMADVRSDTVVRHPELFARWKEIGLRSVVIGFEDISDQGLGELNKANTAANNREAIALLRELGITIVGDFIIDPDYSEADFERLAGYLEENPVDLPMLTVLTPLPGTALHRRLAPRISNLDLDYYTLTNAVLPTRLPEEEFYRRYAEMLQTGHRQARI